MSLIKEFKQLTPGEKITIAWTTVSLLFAAFLILVGITATRGEDIEYTKQRLTVIEQRLNSIDQRIEIANSRSLELREQTDRLSKAVEEVSKHDVSQDYGIAEINKALQEKKPSK